MTDAAEVAVTLRPMRDAELGPFLATFTADWAVDLARIGDLTAAEAEAQARAAVAAELPAGLATPGQHLFSIVVELDGGGDRVVGSLWLSIAPGATGGAGDVGFIEELVVEPAHRGRGIGAAAMCALEDAAPGLGLRALTLQVYAHNPRALALYERLGYQATGIRLRKHIAPSA